MFLFILFYNVNSDNHHPQPEGLDKRSQGREMNQFAEAATRFNAFEYRRGKVVDAGYIQEERHPQQYHHTANHPQWSDPQPYSQHDFHHAYAPCQAVTPFREE